MKKIQQRVHELTNAKQSGKDLQQIVAELVPVLRGWGNYFRSGNAFREFAAIDFYVYRRLLRWHRRRGGQRPSKRLLPPADQLYAMGLPCLQRTVQYPTQATPRRSSVSRVPENGLHGLKGGCGDGPAQ
jgi:hypothetical protein